MTWPLVLSVAHGRLVIPGPGHYGITPPPGMDDDTWCDVLLAASRASLGEGAVGWVPAGGGLLANLPGWENVLLSTQWHAPASLPALEARLQAWCERLGADASSARRLFAGLPAWLEEDERLLLGWLRQLLVRPRLVLCERDSVPRDALLQLLADELAGAALLVVGEGLPPGCQPLRIEPAEVSFP